MTEVVAALIWKEGRFMICRRPPEKARGLLWEFVGGKIEPGETGEEALIRECREELAITVSVGDVFFDVIHEYPDLTVHLTLYHAQITEGDPQLLEHVGLAWIVPEEIGNYEFCPADEVILERIKACYLLRAENGRPQSSASRLQREIACYDLLDSLGIPYLRTDHPPLQTMAACEKVRDLLGQIPCKNLFLCNAQKTQFYLLLLPGEKKFRTAQFSRTIGSARLSFAPESLLPEYLGLTAGSVSVLGLMHDKENRVRLFIDRELLSLPSFVAHPCVNTSCVRFPTEALIEKILPAIGHDYETVDLPDSE